MKLTQSSYHDGAGLGVILRGRCPSCNQAQDDKLSSDSHHCEDCQEGWGEGRPGEHYELFRKEVNVAEIRDGCTTR